MTTLEKDVEQRLVRLIKNHGGLALKWVCPGWAGVPDRIVLLPGGRIYFVELKRPDGRPSELQKAWAKKIRPLGFTVFFLFSKKQVDAFDQVLTLEEAGT